MASDDYDQALTDVVIDTDGISAAINANIDTELGQSREPNNSDVSQNAEPPHSLDFQDIAHTAVSVENKAEKEDDIFEDTDALLHPQKSEADETNLKFWHIKYYKKYFDVTTTQVLKRLARSVRPAIFFHEEDPKPDMYGPFWIATTLVFLMAAASNLAHYWASRGTDGVWVSDFRKLTIAATLFYCVISILPLLIWFLLRRIKQPKPLIHVISLYGYSLFVFVPTCLLCALPFEWLRWILVLASVGVSMAFLIRNLCDLTQSPEQVRALYVVIGAIVIAHVAIGMVMKFYFFQY